MKLLGTTLFVTSLLLAQAKSNTAETSEVTTQKSGLSFTQRPLNTGNSLPAAKSSNVQKSDGTEGESRVATDTDNRPEVTDEAIEKTLNDKRYLQRLLKCAVGEAPCDPVGRRLRSLAPLVLRGNCPMCTPSEHKQIKKVLAYVQVNFPKEWNKILQTYAG